MSNVNQYSKASHKFSTTYWITLYKISAIAALLQLAIMIVYFFVVAALGGKPASLEEYFALFQNSPLEAFLRGDLFSLLIVAFYLGLVPGMFLALRNVDPVGAGFAGLLTLIAVALCFGTNSDFSMFHLSKEYAGAATEAQRSQILAAGEAIVASDMWNSSGAYMSGLFLQGAGMLLSIIMLRNSEFSKITAIAGLIGNGLDLTQHLLHPFLPSMAEVILRSAGPFYLIWFPMLVRDFLRLYKSGDRQYKTEGKQAIPA
ncbi:MAG: DUF4386 family protein [Anaerolineales bacterium]|nr:DUF4386 family protein [Anaerolineales bacterium]